MRPDEQLFEDADAAVGAVAVGEVGVDQRLDVHRQRVAPVPLGLGQAVVRDLEIAVVEPVYPMTQGLTAKPIRKAALSALSKAPDLPEWQDAAWMKRNGWPTWKDAVDTLHNPPGLNGISPEHPARMRLAFDELLANQLTLALVRHHSRRQSGRSLAGDGKLRKALLQAIPFKLSGLRYSF